MKRIIFSILLSLIIISETSFAANHNISTDGTYIAGSSESLDSAKQNALKEAMRHATEQVGVLVSSYTKTHNMVLTDDEITTIASKIIRIKSKKFDVKLLSDSEIQVTAYIDTIINDESINKDIEKLLKENNELKEANTELKAKNNTLSELNRIKYDIDEKYKYYGVTKNGLAKEINITNDSSWKDVVYNFNVCMAHKNYLSAGGYAMQMDDFYMKTLGKEGTDIYTDEIRILIRIKQIERFIAANHYVWAWRFCITAIKETKQYNLSNPPNVLYQYYNILDKYIESNRPDIYKKENIKN